MEHTKIPTEELEIFKSLKNIKVVFDVGARADVDYLELKPNIELHAFEPNPDFFEELKTKIGDRKNVYLNNYGLGDVEGEFEYNNSSQAFNNGECPPGSPDRKLPVKTLDWYVKEHKIKRIDFLKIDTEGYDYKVLLGGKEALKITRYIQFEHWDNVQAFHNLIGKDFWFKNIGYRNVLCRR